MGYINYYGHRYLSLSQFKTFCNEIKIHHVPTDTELERYEKDSILLPVARIIKPEEYVHERYQANQKDISYMERLPSWEILETLLFGNSSNLYHHFDYEFEKNNKYLICPKEGDYQRWDTYKTIIKNQNIEYEVPTLENYYHYWQAYLVNEIQLKYPIYSQYNWILRKLENKCNSEISFLIPPLEIPVKSHTRSGLIRTVRWKK